MCRCMRVLEPREALEHCLDEMRELIEGRNKEEASDVAFTVGRLLGAVMGRIYVRVPGDGMAYEKMHRRYRETGCVRSLAHREMGKCLSDG